MVDKEKFYSGTILKNYRNISCGALSYLKDDPKSISASVSYKLSERSLSDKWQLIGSVTNILNQKTYNYTLVDSSDFSKTFSSYRIRPRNVLLSIYYKF